MTTRELAEMQERAERLQSDADRAAGAAEQQRRELYEQFNVKTLSAARKLLADLERETETESARFDRALTDFTKRYGDRL